MPQTWSRVPEGQGQAIPLPAPPWPHPSVKGPITFSPDLVTGISPSTSITTCSGTGDHPAQVAYPRTPGGQTSELGAGLPQTFTHHKILSSSASV